MDLRGRAALTGVVFAILLVASFLVGGETPGADESAAEVVEFYTDNDDKSMLSAILGGLSSVFLLFFVGTLRNVVRAGEDGAGGLSSVVLAGGTVAAVGNLIFSGLSFTLGDAATDLEPAAVQALSALNSDFFLPLAGGLCTLLLACGLASVRGGALPAWLGWSAIVIGVVLFSPLGFFAFLASILWLLVTSIVLATSGGPGARAAT